MSLEQLTEDLKSNTAEAQAILANDPGNPVLMHLVNTLWPFQEAMLAEMMEQANALDEVVDEAGDMIQAETAGILAAPILAAQKLCEELEKRLGPSELELRGFIAETRRSVQEAAELLEEITIPPGDEDEDGEDDEDEDDDEDDDEGEAKK
jgi:hypothetical protein